MAISEEYNWNPDISEIVEEAFERAGLELRSGMDFRTARRSLNLLTLEWQNKGINLWTVSEDMLAETSAGVSLTTSYLVKGTASYKLPSGTISLLNAELRLDDGSLTSQADYSLARISQPTYATIPNKLTQARPLQYWMQRREILGVASFSDSTCDTNSNTTVTMDSTANVSAGMVVTGPGIISEGGTNSSTTVESVDSDGLTLVLSQAATATAVDVSLKFTTNQNDTMTLWPAPDSSTKYKVVIHRLKRISDTGNPASNTMQIPGRFMPALISGLAYQLALKRPEAQGRIEMLKMMYDEAFMLAAEEDREKASVRFVPLVQSW